MPQSVRLAVVGVWAQALLTLAAGALLMSGMMCLAVLRGFSSAEAENGFDR